MTDTTDFDDGLCTSEYPGDDMFAGQLCELERGDHDQHEHLAVIPGTRYTRRLVWTAGDAR